MNLSRIACFVLIQIAACSNVTSLAANYAANTPSSNFTQTACIGEQDQFEKGLRALHSDNYTQALSSFDRYLTQFPKSAHAYVNRQYAKSKLGMPDADQLIDLNNAIALDRNLLDAYFNRGNVYSRLGFYAKAIDDYSFVAKGNPQDAEVFENRGCARLKYGDRWGSMTDFVYHDLLQARELLRTNELAKCLSDFLRR